MAYFFHFRVLFHYRPVPLGKILHLFLLVPHALCRVVIEGHVPNKRHCYLAFGRACAPSASRSIPLPRFLHFQSGFEVRARTVGQIQLHHLTRKWSDNTTKCIILNKKSKHKEWLATG